MSENKDALNKMVCVHHTNTENTVDYSILEGIPYEENGMEYSTEYRGYAEIFYVREEDYDEVIRRLHENGYDANDHLGEIIR